MISRTMDREELFRLPLSIIVEEVLKLEKQLMNKSVLYCSWHGGSGTYYPPFYKNPKNERRNRGGDKYKPYPDERHDDQRNPWFKLWEIAVLVEETKVRKGDTVLDLGGCSSLFSYYLASKGVNVISIDIAPKAVEVGKTASIKMGWPNLVNREMNILDLNFEDEKFDYVYCLDSFIFLKDEGGWGYRPRLRALKEANRVLKKGGAFGLTVNWMNPITWRYLDNETLTKYAQDSGFDFKGVKDNGKRYLYWNKWYSNASVFLEK